MTDHKCTDEQIIKALDHCRNGERGSKCSKCEYVTGCKTYLIGLALDLINRQRAEIERLQEYYKRYYDLTRETKELQDEVEHARDRLSLFDDAITNAKAEAIKEFAEKMKKRECSNAYCCWCAHSDVYGRRAKKCDEPYIDKNGKEQKACFAYAKFESYIDKLVKEMTEVKEQ